ncbi:hypothetical protein JI739_09185 [Ramlibacter sp. AW1]|uniref:Uncharacterized protein n=1 Tax=Ramlibacter aurantiacus TaxID=2801330 RepID=A0A936ZNF2_9BURK|nr:hypothetical protein [Ramlibacter aurantiacus]MBL0420513.1 hypothetical protein [Ramlibacter aurantiacus]
MNQQTTTTTDAAQFLRQVLAGDSLDLQALQAMAASLRGFTSTRRYADLGLLLAPVIADYVRSEVIMRRSMNMSSRAR